MRNRVEDQPLLTAAFIANTYGPEVQLTGSFVPMDMRTHFVAALDPNEPNNSAVIEFSDSDGKYSWLIHQQPDKLTLDWLELRYGSLYNQPEISNLKFKRGRSDLVVPDYSDIDFEDDETSNYFDLCMRTPEWTAEVLSKIARIGRQQTSPASLPHADLLRALRSLSSQ